MTRWAVTNHSEPVCVCVCVCVCWTVTNHNEPVVQEDRTVVRERERERARAREREVIALSLVHSFGVCVRARVRAYA